MVYLKTNKLSVILEKQKQQSSIRGFILDTIRVREREKERGPPFPLLVSCWACSDCEMWTKRLTLDELCLVALPADSNNKRALSNRCCC